MGISFSPDDFIIKPVIHPDNIMVWNYAVFLIKKTDIPLIDNIGEVCLDNIIMRGYCLGMNGGLKPDLLKGGVSVNIK